MATMIDRETIRGPLGVSLACVGGLNKPETLAKVKEASGVKAELEAYWKRLFAHLRTFQFSAQSVAGEGARSGDLSAEDMGAMLASTSPRH